ncbi:hypothetical protein [Streptomyces sp. NPDC051109]|uniref:hypothetical protein n=1 Tax=Streptomyces sp. NPDC051109 TaxID=3365642 RepID=UPI003798045D
MLRRPIRGAVRGPGRRAPSGPGGSGDEGTDWLAGHGLLVPAGLDLVELPYEVARALRDGNAAPGPRLEPEPFTATTPLPSGWEVEGGTATRRPLGGPNW